MLAGSSENNGNWDKKLSDKVSGPDVPMEDWNTPSDQLWDKIESGLPEKRRRRGAWVWFVGALSALALIASLYLITSNNNGVDEDSAVDTTETLSRNTSDRNDDQNKLHSTNDQYNSNENENNESQSISGKSSVAKERSLKSGTSSNENIKSKGTLENNKQSENEILNTFKGTEKINKEKIASTSKSESNLNIKQELNASRAMSSVAQSADRRNLAFLNKLPTLSPLLGERESAKIEQVPFDEKVTVKNNRGSFILGMNFGMFGDFARLNNNYASLVEPFNFRKSSLPGFEGGISFGYSFNDKWSLLSGVQYRNIRIASGHNATLAYDPANEVYDGHSYYNTYDMNYATSYGVLPAEMSIARANDDVQDETQVGVEIDMTQSISLLSIPLLVRRTVHTNKSGFWSLSIAAGPSISFPIANSTEIDHTYSTNEDLHVYHANIKDELKDLNPVLMNAEVELMNGFNFKRKGNLIISPFFRYGFTPLYERDQLSSRSNEFGIRMYYLFDL